MSTFHSALAGFRETVKERTEKLRMLSFAELAQLAQLNVPSVENLSVESRPAAIAIVIEAVSDGGIRVVVQAEVKAKMLGTHFILEGFRKYSDERVTPLTWDDECQWS